MAVVHVRSQASGSLWEVVRVLLDGAMVGEFLDKNHLLAVWRELETFNALSVFGELLATSAVGIHAPELSTSDECDALAVLNPSGVGLIFRSCSQFAIILSISIHDVKNVVALVFFHTVIPNLVHNLLTIGRCCIAADTPHSPKRLGRQHLAAQFDVTFSYVHFILCFNRTAAEHSQQDSHHHCFSHILIN